MMYDSPAPDGIELIDDPGSHDVLRDEWNALYRDDPNAQIFLSHRWLEDLYRRRPGVCTLLWRDPNRPDSLAAVLPLRRSLVLDRKRRRFRQELLMAGNHWADRTGVLCLPACETQALPRLGRWLAALRWERLRLDSLAIDERRRDLLLESFESDDFRIDEQTPFDNDGTTRLDRAPRIALPATFDRWLGEQLGSGTRQRIRRFRRRLENDSECRIRSADERTIAGDLAAFRRLWLARWADAKGEDADTKADKYLRIMKDGFEAGQMTLRVLEDGGGQVAIHALYDDPVTATVSFFAGARDADFRALPAGLLLHADAIESAIDDGRRCYDLLRGDESYKYRLGARDAIVQSIRVKRKPPRVADVLLESHWRDVALQILGRLELSESASTVGPLYSQLLESWPDEPRVLERFEAWLQSTRRSRAEATGRTTGCLAEQGVN